MVKPNVSREERLNRISAEVVRNGEVGIDGLVKALGVSKMTIHRDLEELERRGVLRKVRNGATAKPTSAFESTVEFRKTVATIAKTALANAAFDMIKPGSAVLIDETTTLLPLVERLAEIEGLTVISNFQPILNSISNFDNVKLISLGGEYVPQLDSFTGPICESTIFSLRATHYITSCTALDSSGVFQPYAQGASAKRAMMRISAQKILLVDNSKFERTAIHKYAELGEFNRILIQSDLPERSRAQLRHVEDRIRVVEII